MIHTHAWHSVLWWSLPVTLVIAALFRAAAPVVAAHLPAGGPLALRDYGVLGRVRHPLAATVWSAVLGGASHLLWDMITHPYVIIVHPFLGGITTIPALREVAVAGLPWWRVIQLVSEFAGTAVVIACALRIGRTRALLAWHGPAPPWRGGRCSSGRAPPSLSSRSPRWPGRCRGTSWAPRGRSPDHQRRGTGAPERHGRADPRRPLPRSRYEFAVIRNVVVRSACRVYPCSAG